MKTWTPWPQQGLPFTLFRMDSRNTPRLQAGMVGFGMIFDETYRPFFEAAASLPLFSPSTGPVSIKLTAAASRTGARAEKYLTDPANRLGSFKNFSGAESVANLLAADIDAVCIATPDDRHFEPARAALKARKHILIEKPSVLTLQDLDELTAIAAQNQVLAKVVYHK